jgi:hypothetical protein
VFLFLRRFCVLGILYSICIKNLFIRIATNSNK